jgi:hypothetical protein
MVYYSKMGQGVAARAAFIFLTLSLVFACGELDTMIPSSGSYHVRTLVNGVPIEECSIIRSGDKIRPYFTVSVANDPDLVSLLVYFQDLQGRISGGKVRYTLRPTEVTAQAEKKAQEEQDADEAVSEQIEAKTVEEDQNKEIEIVVKSLARELPYFPLSASLAIGSYTLVFEAQGNKEILSRTEIDVFYLSNAEFNLKDIAMYLPGVSDSQLISPSTTVLLETRLDFDARLDPYVVWYNGRNIISEGKVSAGAGSILWDAPEQAGFYSLRLEAFPFQLKRNCTGIFRGIALPVSPKAVDMGYFFRNDSNNAAQSLAAKTAHPELAGIITPENSDGGNARPPLPSLPPELLQWYRFEGSLESSTPLPGEEQSLLQVSAKKARRWAGAGQSYGLSTGLDDVYQLPLVNFFKGKDRGGGIFRSHIRLPAEGVILSAFFPLKSSSSEGAWVEMISEGNIIALIINAGGASVEIPVNLDVSEMQGFIPIATEFYVLPNRLDARITLGENLKSNAGGINLPAALSGESRIRLGGQEKFKRENRLEAPVSTAAGTAKPARTAEGESADIFEADETVLSWENRETNAIWDELAILLSSVSFSSERFGEKSPRRDNERTGGNESFLTPVANTGVDVPIKEPRMLSVLSEDY